MVTFMKFAAPEASVLIVDDNEINLEVTAALLEPLKMKVDLAESGKRALILAHQKRYHLIFMDQMMPDLDGVETTKRLRRLPDAYCRTVPVIALTANAFSEVREELQQAGMNDYLAKPVEAKDLYRCVLKWIPRKLIIVSQEQQKPGGQNQKKWQPQKRRKERREVPALYLQSGRSRQQWQIQVRNWQRVRPAAVNYRAAVHCRSCRALIRRTASVIPAVRRCG